jgi:hypothetical protein
VIINRNDTEIIEKARQNYFWKINSDYKKSDFMLSCYDCQETCLVSQTKTFIPSWWSIIMMKF